MRLNRLISPLVLATVGCSLPSESEDLLEHGDDIENPDPGAHELVVDRQVSEGGGYGILLIDTTSSMTTVRSSTGNTRCYDAKVMARAIINDFFDPSGTDGDGFAIWGFANDTQTNDDVQPTISGYYTDAQSAINAVDALSCDGSTPLADALCKGVNGDGETFTIDPMLDYLFILTDGFENNSDGPCSGPSGDIDTVGTWQYNVMAEMNSTGIKVDTRYWVDPDILASEQTIGGFASDQPHDPSTEELLIVADIEELPQSTVDRLMFDAEASSANTGTVACDTLCQELALFEEMALVSGGSWGVVRDNDSDYPAEEAVDPPSGPKHPTEEPEPLPTEGV